MSESSELKNFNFNQNKKLRDISNYRVLDPRFDYYDQMSEYKKLASLVQTDKDMLLYYPDWYLIDGEYYYFKSKAIFIELFISELFKEYGIPALNFEIVTNNNTLGIMSKNFKSLVNTYYRFDEFVEMYGDYKHQYDVESLTKLFRNTTSISDANRIMSIIQRVIPLDVMFGQSDRVDYNICFEKSGSNLCLCPMFDNGYSFKREFDNNYISSFQNLYFKMDDSYSDDEGIKYSSDIIKRNLFLFYQFKKAMYVDIDKILNRVSKKYNVFILKEQVEFIKDYYNKKRDMVNKTLNIF